MSDDTRLAYVILAHRSPRQVVRLVRALHRDGDFFRIHVDARSPDRVFDEIRDGVGDRSGVRMLERIPCQWGGWNSVRVAIGGVESLLEEPGWSHAMSLSAQDFPVQGPDRLAAYLSGHRGSSFVDARDAREWREAMLRIRRFYVLVGDTPRWIPLVPRRLPRGVRPFYGSQWWTLSREACEYLVSDDPLVRRLRRYYRHAIHCDEGFWSTAMANSPLRDSVVNDSKRFLEFVGSHPRDLGPEDVPAILDSGAFFARKFADDERGDAAVELLSRASAPL